MINTSSWYSVSFDESFNKNQQKCQMDVNLRYWNDEKNIAETSKFLLRPNAENLKCELVASILGLDLAKFLQLSMDGPSTNWNVLNLVNNHLVENGYKNSIEIGSCTLHIVHGAFQTGATKSGNCFLPLKNSSRFLLEINFTIIPASFLVHVLCDTAISATDNCTLINLAKLMII